MTFHLILNYSETYFQTLEGVPWFLRLKKTKQRQEISKNLKKASFIKKLLKFVTLKS